MTPHLTETQTTMSSVASWQLPIHSLLVLQLQLLIDLLIFLTCRGDTSHSRHNQPVQLYPSMDRPVRRMCDSEANLIVLGVRMTQHVWEAQDDSLRKQSKYHIFHKLNNKLTAAEVRRWLVVTNDKTPSVFFL